MKRPFTCLACNTPLDPEDYVRVKPGTPTARVLVINFPLGPDQHLPICHDCRDHAHDLLDAGQ